MKEHQRVKLPDTVKHEGLVTERDIDEEFGLFTEVPEIGSAYEQKTEQKREI
ncbi:hypothetical protein [Paenibacillus sp. 1011MAR3C5]|uniref:hypothetical protein n=1 Tax=Paenibacillus sp. 1011MAR3C5 TaxID=1675787 RepID=UPI0016037547|nr:hypothetical protein [Paenibacillus sp. 1011MAR3C5]